jgi:hypothetical protein
MLVFNRWKLSPVYTRYVYNKDCSVSVLGIQD